MLVHQVQQSEGTGSNAVKLTDRNISNIEVGGTVHSGIKTGSDGVLSKIQANGGFSAIIGEWLLFGSSASFWIQRTIISGTLEVDPGGGFLQMNTDRTYDNQKSSAGEKITTVFFEISTSAGGSPVVESATMIFTSTRI